MKKKEAKRGNKHIRTGDKVVVIRGNDRGEVGEVLSRTRTHAVVQGVNVRKKAIRRSQEQPQGGYVDIERPVHISNIMLCNEQEKPVKLRVAEKGEAKVLVYAGSEGMVEHRTIKKSSS